jgi:O-acetyl-ADP-ribose deacetylase
MHRVQIAQADITTLEVDAIVNTANNSLLGGRGVDGAIHDAAGPGLLAECRTLGGCPSGQARITGGYNLPAQYVIHTVGPVWRGGKHHEDELLADCYRNSLTLALGRQCKTIAFPAISTGAYGFPLDRAARIAVQAVDEFLRADALLGQVVLCCFDNEAKAAFSAQVAALSDPRRGGAST